LKLNGEDQNSLIIDLTIQMEAFAEELRLSTQISHRPCIQFLILLNVNMHFDIVK
jgi:hypothetical protein